MTLGKTNKSFPNQVCTMVTTGLKTITRLGFKSRFRPLTNNHHRVFSCCSLSSSLSASVQFKMVSMRSRKPIRALPHYSEVSPTLPLKQSNVHLIDQNTGNGLLSSCQRRLPSTSSFLSASRALNQPNFKATHRNAMTHNHRSLIERHKHTKLASRSASSFLMMREASLSSSPPSRASFMSQLMLVTSSSTCPRYAATWTGRDSSKSKKMKKTKVWHI